MRPLKKCRRSSEMSWRPLSLLRGGSTVAGGGEGGLAAVAYLMEGQHQPVPNFPADAIEFVIRGQRDEIDLGNVHQSPDPNHYVGVNAHDPPAGALIEPGTTVNLQFANIPY